MVKAYSIYRPVKPLSKKTAIANMYVGVITCDRKNVTAKSEFPIRTSEDVPFTDVYSKEKDNTPFDISDIIAERRPRKLRLLNMNGNTYKR